MKTAVVRITRKSQVQFLSPLQESDLMDMALALRGDDPAEWRLFLDSVFKEASGLRQQVSFIDLVRGVRSQAKFLPDRTLRAKIEAKLFAVVLGILIKQGTVDESRIDFRKIGLGVSNVVGKLLDPSNQ